MISILFGTRPEIIKLYPIIEIFKKKKIDFSIIHTGQHYNEKLSNQFINQFKFPKNKSGLIAICVTILASDFPNTGWFIIPN